jgi:hypothetical protein
MGLILSCIQEQGEINMIKKAFEINMESEIGQLRAAPVNLGREKKGILLCWSSIFDVDPFSEMFYFPTDTLKMTMISEKGQILWSKDLGRGVVPGLWFCPVLPLDLDGDGADEIFYVDNLNIQHPLTATGYALTILDSLTGEKKGTMPWPENNRNQSLSSRFRNFLIGGRAGDKNLLVTAQGTYEDMHLQGWTSPDKCIWKTDISTNESGARGSHMCALSNFDQDGDMEVMWGERCIRLRDGQEIFCADRDSYHGHSDVALPVKDYSTGEWLLYTCRESENDVSPRVALYDKEGKRIWGRLDEGHIDMGWAARSPESGQLFGAIRIGHKSCGPDGRFHQDREEFVYDREGNDVKLPFSHYHGLPVDLQGRGYHDFAFTEAEEGLIVDSKGNELAKTGGTPALLCRFLDLPGEQVLSYAKDGTVAAWYNDEPVESPDFKAKINSGLYLYDIKMGISGYNIHIMCGL